MVQDFSGLLRKGHLPESVSSFTGESLFVALDRK